MQAAAPIMLLASCAYAAGGALWPLAHAPCTLSACPPLDRVPGTWQTIYLIAHRGWACTGDEADELQPPIGVPPL